MIHAIIAFVTCAVLYATSLPWACMLWPVAFYMGREHSQAEYRYIEAHGHKRAKCPWYCGLIPSAWTWKSVLDFALPWLVGLAFAVLSIFYPASKLF